MSNREFDLDPGLHSVAVAQATSLANHANRAQANIGEEVQLHDVLTFLVLAGLSIELYFKAIMLFGRNGRVTGGHNLKVLYDELPDFLRNSLSQNYLSQYADISLQIKVIAIIQRTEQTSVPDKTELDKSYESFEAAIESISNIFTRSRYFFEKVNKNEYSYIEYPVGQIKSVISSLDSTYRSYINNEFIDKTA